MDQDGNPVEGEKLLGLRARHPGAQPAAGRIANTCIRLEYTTAQSAALQQPDSADSVDQFEFSGLLILSQATRTKDGAPGNLHSADALGASIALGRAGPHAADRHALLKPGLRLAVGLSGGADSVALLRALVASERRNWAWCSMPPTCTTACAARRPTPIWTSAASWRPSWDCRSTRRAWIRRAEAKADSESGKAGETIEEAARRLRYAWFRQLMARGEVDAVATAHTLDDQAETVLAKFLRGAWTEGLSGIHPVLEFPEGRILRPLLGDDAGRGRGLSECAGPALARGFFEPPS